VTAKPVHIRPDLTAKWILASGLGVVLGLFVGLNVAWIWSASVLDTSEALVAHLVSGGVVGLAVGIAQWLVLRRHVVRTRGWILVSTMGMSLGFVVSALLGFPVLRDMDFSMGFELPSWETGAAFSFALGGPVVGGLIGVGVGIGQRLILRRKVLRARWWMLASTIGLSLGWATGSFFSELGLVFGLISLMPTWLAGPIVQRLDALGFDLMRIDKLLAAGLSTGVVFGAITGAVLLRLLQRSEESWHNRIRGFFCESIEPGGTQALGCEFRFRPRHCGQGT
jgi:uncharacterized integral membrane protein